MACAFENNCIAVQRVDMGLDEGGCQARSCNWGSWGFLSEEVTQSICEVGQGRKSGR